MRFRVCLDISVLRGMLLHIIQQILSFIHTVGESVFDVIASHSLRNIRTIQYS